MLQVVQIAWPPTHPFVRLQIVKTDHFDGCASDRLSERSCVAVFEPDSVDVGENLDSQWGDSHPDDAIRLNEKIRFENGGVEPELLQARNDPQGIFTTTVDPDIHISSRSQVPVKRNRESADEQVLNVVVVQQPQELAEVGRKLDLSHS
jgi:hypothetical protein